MTPPRRRDMRAPGGYVGTVQATRRLFRDFPLLATLLCAAALLLRVLVPGGYMLSDVDGRIAMTVCPGVVAMPDMPGHGGHAPAGHGKAMEAPCAFAGAAAPLLGTVDPVLLVAALALVAAAAMRLAPPAPARRRPHLRPPLRGPPARP